MDIKELLKLPRDKQLKILSKASELVENQHKERSKKRLEALERARAIKTQRAKNKIIGAMNILKLYGKKPTVRAISLESGVSKTTVQKYISSKKEAKVDPKINNQAEWVTETLQHFSEDHPNYREEAELASKEAEEAWNNLPRFEEDTVLNVTFKELIWFKGVCDDLKVARRFDRDRKVWIVPKGTKIQPFER